MYLSKKKDDTLFSVSHVDGTLTAIKFKKKTIKVIKGYMKLKLYLPIE